MKKKFRLKNIIIILISGITLYCIHYYLYVKTYDEIWENGLTLKTMNDEIVTKNNYKSERFKRIVIPSCATCGALCFEELEFINDSTLRLTHNSYAARDFNIYEKLFNWPDTVINEIYTMKEDSLLSDPNLPERYYMLWSFSNDTFKIRKNLIFKMLTYRNFFL